MALTRTTLSTAVGLDDTSIVVAAATGFAQGRIVRIDQEFLVIQLSYNGTSTTVPVRRGQLGSRTTTHVASAGVVVGTAADDWDSPGTAAKVNNMIAGKPRIIESITADNSTVTHTPAGTDHVLILNGTSVINLTVPVPTTDMDGDLLFIGGNGVAAHVVTVTGGLGAVGGTADVVTFSATQRQVFCMMAINAVWNAVALGTASANVTGPTVA